MSRFKELVQTFKQHGYKMTPQRRIIIKVLTGDTRHPTAEQIHELVEKRMPDISLSTVYNTLHELTGMEALYELDTGCGGRHYEISREGHAHQVCLTCGRIEDVAGDFEKVKLLFEYSKDFCPARYAVTIYGYCADCAPSGE
jgi:Fe2+ or Zn2+ uptake regulation protein